MSDEVNDLRDGISDSVGKFMSAPRIKEAFSKASTALKVAGGAVALGLLWKPALLLGVAALGYAAYKGFEGYSDYDGGGGDDAPKPRDLDI